MRWYTPTELFIDKSLIFVKIFAPSEVFLSNGTLCFAVTGKLAAFKWCFSTFKWTNHFRILTLIHRFTHQWWRICIAMRLPPHWHQLGVHCHAQGHFDMHTQTYCSYLIWITYITWGTMHSIVCWLVYILHFSVLRDTSLSLAFSEAMIRVFVSQWST